MHTQKDETPYQVHTPNFIVIHVHAVWHYALSSSEDSVYDVADDSMNYLLGKTLLQVANLANEPHHNFKHIAIFLESVYAKYYASDRRLIQLIYTQNLHCMHLVHGSVSKAVLLNVQKSMQ